MVTTDVAGTRDTRDSGIFDAELIVDSDLREFRKSRAELAQWTSALWRLVAEAGDFFQFEKKTAEDGTEAEMAVMIGNLVLIVQNSIINAQITQIFQHIPM